MPSVATGPVVLRAAEASWIEVRAETGEVVHAKLMKAGDSYEVPQRAGLRLTTGNAGGLDVTVGGEVTPKLGARGAVIREIPLEGPRLLSGTATRN
jgi:cytoskeleton protein RodZ